MRRLLLLAACAMPLLAGAATAQQPPQQSPQQSTGAPAYSPTVGQAGKDVVWVPTQQQLVDRMLDMARVTAQDYVVDLGSGDGRTVITAAQRGARAHGIEFNPDMVALSRRNAEAAGVTGRASFVQADIFQSDFSDATVVTLFLLQTLNERLRPTLLAMKPGTRVVSNTFTMGDWKPDQSFDTGAACASFCRAYLWIIPARVAGTWQIGEDRLVLEQRYQGLTGTLTQGGQAHAISEAKMEGEAITFTANGRRYTGRLEGGALTGQVEGGAAWRAVKAAG
ncbi:class I SAM-dependent methyltransferase [Roseomonas sp. USHLN139]|uniref:class I SAM-dependent methyltransferase n=1 Tax=Roseomonas sp. USHLN139 TaxID=3081298 RepID=UPI003B01C8AD